MGWDQRTRELERELERQEAMGVGGCSPPWRWLVGWILVVIVVCLLASA